MKVFRFKATNQIEIMSGLDEITTKLFSNTIVLRAKMALGISYSFRVFDLKGNCLLFIAYYY